MKNIVSLSKIVTCLEQILCKIKEWCMLNCKKINVDKTKYCLYGSRKVVETFKDRTLRTNSCKITQCHQYNYLVVIMDGVLNMKGNFNNFFKKFSYKTYQFGKIKKYINIPTHILVYKQTILPFVEYVSFMLCLNNKHEIDKLQRVQNKCLRICYNINTPTDIGTVQLHENARTDHFCIHRDLSLMNIMFQLRVNNMYEKEKPRATRAYQGYIFDLKVPNMVIYAKSPYYIGTNKWYSLPVNLKMKYTIF